MTKKENNFGCASVLAIGVFLLFLGLKLADVGVVATWSWWWIFSPLWIPAVIILLLAIVWVLAYAICMIKRL